MNDADDNPYRAPSTAPTFDASSADDSPSHGDPELAFLRRERRGYATTVGILTIVPGALAGMFVVIVFPIAALEGLLERSAIGLVVASAISATFLTAGIATCRRHGLGLPLATTLWVAVLGLFVLVVAAFVSVPLDRSPLAGAIAGALCILTVPGVLALLAAAVVCQVGEKIRVREMQAMVAEVRPGEAAGL